MYRGNISLALGIMVGSGSGLLCDYAPPEQQRAPLARDQRSVGAVLPVQVLLLPSLTLGELQQDQQGYSRFTSERGEAGPGKLLLIYARVRERGSDPCPGRGDRDCSHLREDIKIRDRIREQNAL